MRTQRIIATAAAAALLTTLVVSIPANAASPTGHKHITAVEAAGGKISVKWGATTGVKYYKVKVSGSPDMKTTPKTYKVSKKKTKIVVKPAKYAGPNTGNYSFVRVYAYKKNGKIGVSPYRKVKLVAASAQAPAGDASIDVATFNVRTADAGDSGALSWANRLPKVAAQIRSSGAAVVAIQEAGAHGTSYTRVVDSTGAPHKDFYWQFEQLRDAVGAPYTLANDQEYSYGVGKESTRILYDATKVRLLDQGNFAPSTPTKDLAFIPWAHFQDLSSGKQFYFFAVHLANNAKGHPETYWSALRAKQAAVLIARAKSFVSTGQQVIVAGDMNSNMYTQPSNVVDAAFIKEGAYDANSTAAVTNDFYATFNNFAKPKVSGARTDYIFTFGNIKGAYSSKDWITKDKLSDHFMQSAVLPL